MFFKRLTFLAFLATVFSSASAQKLDATFDVVRFKASDTKNMVELYCSINGNSVVYKKVPDGFQASVALELLASDSVGIRFAEKMMLRSPVVKDTSQYLSPFNLQKRIFLPEGNFKFTGNAHDVNSGHPASQVEMPVQVSFKKDKVQFSDVQLLESYQQSQENSDYTKSGFKLISYVSNFYPKGLDKLKFYTEIYNTEAVIGKDKQIVVLYRVVPTRDNLAKVTIAGQKVQKTAPVNVLLSELNISSLTSGNYELVVEVRDQENKSLAMQSRYFQRSNPQTAAEQIAKNTNGGDLPAAFSSDLDSTNLNLYIRALRPLAKAAEQDILETAVKQGTTLQKQHYLYSFFKKRSETNPEKAWNEYRARIEYVEKMFGNPTFGGHETDMGRVYLQYGAPNQVTNERTDVNRPSNNTDYRPYQIWHYYQLERQNNRVFVFLQQNLGNNNYTLAHSTANGEISNNEWRKIAGKKFMRSDRNQRDNRTFDREGNEIGNPDMVVPRGQ